MGSIRPILPPVDGWALQVISRGGLTTGDTGDLVIRSNGVVEYVSGGDAVRMARGDLNAIAQRIHGMDRSQWTIGSRLGNCSDCVATLVVLTTRDADGIHRYIAFWDPTTRGRISPDVIKIHDLAVGSTRQVAFGK